jgi:hypothetical protein
MHPTQLELLRSMEKCPRYEHAKFFWGQREGPCKVFGGFNQNEKSQNT